MAGDLVKKSDRDATQGGHRVEGYTDVAYAHVAWASRTRWATRGTAFGSEHAHHPPPAGRPCGPCRRRRALQRAPTARGHSLLTVTAPGRRPQSSAYRRSSELLAAQTFVAVAGRPSTRAICSRATSDRRPGELAHPFESSRSARSCPRWTCAEGACRPARPAGTSRTHQGPGPVQSTRAADGSAWTCVRSSRRPGGGYRVEVMTPVRALRDHNGAGRLPRSPRAPRPRGSGRRRAPGLEAVPKKPALRRRLRFEELDGLPRPLKRRTKNEPRLCAQLSAMIINTRIRY